jgi:hypothetical protein
MRERIIGIDFSANARKAGSLTRIATGSRCGSRTQIDACFPIPGPSTREAAHGALVRYIAEQADAVIGIDFPFALPAQIMGATHWPDFILGFGGAHADPDAFRIACMRRAGGRELKRLIDVTACAPYSGYNIRMKTMAFHAIRDVLAPLVARDLARALPMQRPRPASRSSSRSAQPRRSIGSACTASIAATSPAIPRRGGAFLPNSSGAACSRRCPNRSRARRSKIAAATRWMQ